MNPSYNSGGLNTPGVKPGVIASGPDDGSVSSGAGPVSPRPNKYIPPRQQPSMPPAMQLGGSSRKSKKGIVIGAILIVVALVLGVLAVVMMPKGGGNSGNAGGNSDFYKYANYLLYGNSDANVDLGEYDDNADYAVVVAFGDEDAGYFDTLRSLWSGFYEKIMKDENISETSVLKGDVSFQNELMDFVEKYMKVEEWNEEYILKLFIENGFENAQVLIEKNYENLKDTAYERGANYAEDLINNGKVTLDLYSIYDNYGCIKDGSIDDGCIEKNTQNLDGAVTSYFESIIEPDTTILEYTINKLAENCFAISIALGGDDE